jgi:hypothetical protein
VSVDRKAALVATARLSSYVLGALAFVCVFLWFMPWSGAVLLAGVAVMFAIHLWRQIYAEEKKRNVR